MTDPRNPSIALELPAYLVDTLADWARADAHIMRLDGADGWRAADHQRSRLADNLVRALLSHLPDLAGAGDLAAALNDRAAAYAEYNAAKSQ